MKIWEHQTWNQDILPTEQFAGQEFFACTFSGLPLIETDFQGTHFSECSFASCDLHMLQMKRCRLQDVLFTDCKIVGVPFFLCERRFFTPQFQSCVLIGCNFSHLSMRGISFCKSKVHECSFLEADLTRANLQETDFAGSLFHHTNLAKADFKGARNYAINPQVNVVKKARFSLPDALCLLESFEVDIF
ncbi:MAG: pentapeptide repeat-containing protein [Chlamydiota bacterium]